MTEPRYIDPNLMQGSSEAAILSSTGIDRGTDVTFRDSDSEVQYFGYQLAPLRYVDDILRMGETLDSAQKANILMEDLFEQKSLSFNLKKSQFLVMGNKRSKKQITKELEKRPLMLCSNEMVETKLLNYLGDYLSNSLEDSVHQTVLKRVKVIKHTI